VRSGRVVATQWHVVIAKVFSHRHSGGTCVSVCV
jgi:hypothetical protein